MSAIGRFNPLKLNPAPVMVTCETVTFPFPELVNVSVAVLLLPTGTVPKLLLEGIAARPDC